MENIDKETQSYFDEDEQVFTLDDIKDNVIDWTYENIGEQFKFRPNQLETIVHIINNIINDSKETTIIEAPTGSGKSLICIITAGVLAKYHNKKSYILASDLYLWSQYMDAINTYHLNDFGYLKGSIGNYRCDVNHMDFTLGRCKMEKVSLNNLRLREWRNQHGYRCVSTCEYMKSRFRAEQTPVTLLTYHLWLYQMNLVDHTDEIAGFKPRPVIFCDECHNIPEIVQKYAQPVIDVTQDKQKLMDIVDFIISENINMNMYEQCVREDVLHDIEYNSASESEYRQKGTRRYIRMKDVMEQYDYFIDSLILAEMRDEQTMFAKLDILRTYVQFLSFIDSGYQKASELLTESITINNTNSKKQNKEDIHMVQVFNWFHNYYSMLCEFYMSMRTAGEEYIIIEKTVDKYSNKTTFTLSCAKEDYMCHQYLMKHAKFKVMTSATIGNRESYMTNIGVGYTESKIADYNVIPNSFDFSKSPIYYLPTYKMSYENKKRDFPEIMKVVYNILGSERFKNLRGMINTGSYENAKMIYDNAPVHIKQRLCMYNSSKDKNEQIKIYKSSTNKVMIGPSLVEGVDLPGDLCRFILIVKVPYPSIASKLIKAKMKLFPLWYDSTTSNTIIQNIGRGVRNENDWCTTFILDGCFGWLYQKTMSQYPVEIQRRIMTLK